MVRCKRRVPRRDSSSRIAAEIVEAGRFSVSAVRIKLPFSATLINIRKRSMVSIFAPLFVNYA